MIANAHTILVREKMKKELYDFLISLNYEDEDIKQLEKQSPALGTLSLESAIDAINLVIEAGFPKCDIDILITLNPAFLTRDLNYLYEELYMLGDDIETKLKDNPYLI